MMRWLQNAWKQFQDFCVLESDASYLWPRWIMLRAFGLVYVLIFAGIIAYTPALLGADGIAPIRETIESLRQQYPNALEAFLQAPSLFWFGAGPGMIGALAWIGLAAAVAVVLNVGPRLGLIACWVCFLSFVSTGHFFSATQPDQLMLEVALLAIPFAPAGWRPGLGTNAPPRAITVCALRFMLFRLMFEAGLAKFVYGCSLWRDFTAMDVMYQTAPFPTILGYLDHRMPHAHHVMEILLTFLAEIPAPFLMLFGGRRWRWFGFIVWGVFQAGIELTNNFGWLNIAAIALAVVLLDDRMLADAARTLRLPRLGGWFAARVAKITVPPVRPWARWSLRTALAAQALVAIYAYVVNPLRLDPASLPASVTTSVDLLFKNFRSANAYSLFANLQSTRYVVEFVGSNDGGETWRSYDYRYLAHRVDRMSPFIAPWYPRFDAILQNTTVVTTDQSLFQAVAAHLLRRDPAIVQLFKNDPFADRPATMIRMPTYQLTYVDLATHRATGRYWIKDFAGDYAPMMLVNENGDIVAAE